MILTIIYLDVNIFRPVKKKTKNHQWSTDNLGKTLNKRSLISKVARPALEEALARTETITNAFKMTGLYPFNPLAVNRSKILPGNKFQRDQNDSLLLDTVVEVTHEDFIPEETVVLQTAPLSPQAGPSKAPDLVNANLEEGLTQGTSTDAPQSFSCINCDNDNAFND